MIKIGMMIGDRYEILEKIGTGGMSDVYKAKDHKLNRFVAVKVLKQEFSENANFVSKFRIEAQAAAGLMHPNIVNVYDVGEENSIYYIVMELVEGITLKKYIEKKARLSYKEAVSIAIQVSMGIEAAHNNHIIHRDIKPQNIIISRDGKVKVTDFGIAKAATSNTITSNVMGSVHYTSPEQARGGYSDEKSDIYSLGITMFEMLTGRVPFNGETTVAIAIKHIQEEMPSPAEYVPEIPGSVESIVLKCCQKSPDRRYQNVQELLADLKQSLINPDEDFVTQNDPDMDGGTRMITDNDMAQIKRRTIYQEPQEDSMRLLSDTEAMYEGDELAEEDEDEYDYNPRVERVTTVLAILAGIVICIIIIILALRVFGGEGDDKDPSSPIITDEPSSSGSSSVEYVPMPDVRGTNVEDARNTLINLGIHPEVQYEESDTIDVGVVIGANVEKGEDVALGSTVILTASAGPAGVEVPGVVDDTFEEGENRLTALGFAVTKMEAYSDTIAKGVIVSQSPMAGTKAPQGSNITVTVSLGKEEVKLYVPDLIGKTEQDGTIMAIEAGLEIGDVSYVFSSEYPEGQICYQSYSHGSYVDPGTTLEIRVSKGPETHTYKYETSIAAPTKDEAPDYKLGDPVYVTLIGDDDQVLLEREVEAFPVATNIYGIKCSGGTITLVYTVSAKDPETGQEISGAKQEKVVHRRVEFTVE
ncbi:MAG: Stk1 family PASTA domain-containing Ser/Thr kinase [Eubacterium sp.]|nr:Stk1 family PASTA domain-containing Ser/Thr kinase [Eubacterium sp.]MCM1215322.1 Stk1 family PASTA domain-containing Ser/Thr kinase [Lachnospiraceae bacterium]MCM1303664.1 Stk1 family PASTA domain-containing Ser/Thr kinase [Butyrivibrio sp.]MCM1344154.1 Stk1 family PASTA domain-containing Ser/Thr kinase [Muribaculaceae bacterium]MCM1240196.1 Stk1 family PASTA domain-containing Ser/Thr kinase [Lachnospiraceae bacterium]